MPELGGFRRKCVGSTVRLCGTFASSAQRFPVPGNVFSGDQRCTCAYHAMEFRQNPGFVPWCRIPARPALVSY